MQLPVPMFAIGDIVRIIDDREKVMKAQQSIGTEWTDDLLDVSVRYSIKSAHSKISFSYKRF